MPRREPRGIAPTQIAKLANSMTCVTVEGTVIDLSPSRTVRTKYGQVTSLVTGTLSDDHDTIKLTLWGPKRDM